MSETPLYYIQNISVGCGDGVRDSVYYYRGTRNVDWNSWNGEWPSQGKDVLSDPHYCVWRQGGYHLGWRLDKNRVCMCVYKPDFQPVRGTDWIRGCSCDHCDTAPACGNRLFLGEEGA